jgi:hypothetical protein
MGGFLVLLWARNLPQETVGKMFVFLNIIYHKHGGIYHVDMVSIAIFGGKMMRRCLHNLGCSNKHEFKPIRIWYGVVSRAVRAMIFFWQDHMEKGDVTRAIFGIGSFGVSKCTILHLSTLVFVSQELRDGDGSCPLMVFAFNRLTLVKP